MKFIKHEIPNLEIKKQLEDWLHIKILGSYIKVPEGNSEAVKNFIEAKVEENTEIPMKRKIVTCDELWLEFKKAIDFGNFTKFKTRRGFNGHINRLIKRRPGKELHFLFNPGNKPIFECILPVKLK